MQKSPINLRNENSKQECKKYRNYVIAPAA